jgi:RHS repeat-associated protein
MLPKNVNYRVSSLKNWNQSLPPAGERKGGFYHFGTITHLKTDSTITEFSFDAWGRRRDKDDWSYTLTSEPALFADRGFTAHEFLSDFNLYNMNGRLYDPVVGRFLSPDPFIADPSFSQSYNRYAYALNNPLKYNDPNGELPFLAILGIVWAGNYAIGWLDNVINKKMSAKEAFRNTSLIAGVNFSPADMSKNNNYGFSNNQSDAQKLVGQQTNGMNKINQEIIQKQKTYGKAWRESGANSDFIQSLLLNPIRLKVPVAEGVSFGADAQAVLLASEFQPLGFAQIKYGPDKGKSFIFSELTGGAGWISADATINTIHFYYLGNTDNLTIKDFEGWMYASSFSVNVGLSYGIGISWFKDESDNYLIGVTKSFGIGVGPTIGSGTGGGSYTKIHKIWGY